ncbi:hypothetical protein [Desulfocurvus sp.]|jgi:hypothetical protein|uniref:hypothetical protein n=1 Tax=Desulfocurvus sp. TaxID=2871698 RepID=UPI0025C632D8|nr:hypothetical protein [Desulfocurvus sp.]MCK9241551.1 hypothetical protein [Desulfocurvus sp.]
MDFSIGSDMSVTTVSTGMSRQEFGAQVVSKTLDYMNSNSSSGFNADYDFQTSVLGAAYSGKGTMVEMMI